MKLLKTLLIICLLSSTALAMGVEPRLRTFRGEVFNKEKIDVVFKCGFWEPSICYITKTGERRELLPFNTFAERDRVFAEIDMFMRGY